MMDNAVIMPHAMVPVRHQLTPSHMAVIAAMVPIVKVGARHRAAMLRAPEPVPELAIVPVVIGGSAASVVNVLVATARADLNPL